MTRALPGKPARAPWHWGRSAPGKPGGRWAKPSFAALAGSQNGIGGLGGLIEADFAGQRLESTFGRVDLGGFAVAEPAHHAEQLFVVDEASMMLELVPVDGLGELADFRSQVVSAIGELATLAGGGSLVALPLSAFDV